MLEYGDQEFSESAPVFEFYNPSDFNCPSCPSERIAKTNEVLARIFNLEKKLKSKEVEIEDLKDQQLQAIDELRTQVARMGVYEKQDLLDDVEALRQENERLREDFEEFQQQMNQMTLDNHNWNAENSECVMRIQNLERELNTAMEENMAISGRLNVQLDVSKELACKLQDKDKQISHLQQKVINAEKEFKEKLKAMETKKQDNQVPEVLPNNDSTYLKNMIITILVFIIAYLLTCFF